MPRSLASFTVWTATDPAAVTTAGGSLIVSDISRFTQRGSTQPMGTVTFGASTSGDTYLFGSASQPPDVSGTPHAVTSAPVNARYLFLRNMTAGAGTDNGVAGLGEIRVYGDAVSGTVSRLSLADIVKGGNGTGTGFPGLAIDPRNGAIASGDPGGLNQTNDTNHFSPGPYPFVNGVFIPDGGPNHLSVQLNSVGNTFSNFPNTDSNSWDYIEGGINQGSGSVLGGVDYNSAGHTMLGLHANKGITFDLDAIRAAYAGYAIQNFMGVAGIVSGSGLADFWVFLDGSLVASQTNLNNPAIAFPINIPILNSNRFLTFVSTDAGNGYGYGQIIIGDPMLQLVPEPATLSLLALGGLALLRRRRESR